MNNEEIKKRLKERDRCVRALTKDGKFRIISIKSSTTARTAQIKHNLEPIPAAFLARALSSAMMMASLQKEDERVIIDVDTNGPINKLSAEAIQTGEVRGFCFHSVPLPVELKSMSDYLGEGLLRVIKILHNRSEPLTSVIPLQKSDITTDMAYYFALSEQISSAVLLDVEFDDDGLIIQSGGFIVQAMPGATTSEISFVMDSIEKAKKLTNYYEQGLHPEQIIKEILDIDFDVLKIIPVDFFCRCSKDNFLDKIKTLDVQEIIDMKEKKQNELVCRYCNNKYYIEEQDFDKLLLEKKAVSN